MERIIITDIPDHIKEFLAMEDGPVKNIKYFKDIKDVPYVISDLIKKEDGTMHHGHSTYTIKKGKKYYAKVKSKQGFTLDNKGKLKIWYGSDISKSVGMYPVLQALKHDWFTNEGNTLWNFMTKTLFEKILTGKITNPIDFLSGYLKLSRIKASPKLLYDVCKKKGVTKIEFLRKASVAKDVNHLLEWYLKETGLRHSADDMVNQALILDKKIDFKWSDRRMEEEHKNWTKAIMNIEADSIPDCKVNHYGMIRHLLPSCFEPLETQKRVFEEGTLMQHCIYTNYWKDIANGNYMAFHIEYKGERATLSFYITYRGLEVSQLYGPRNRFVSDDMRHFIDNHTTDIISKSKDIIKKYLSDRARGSFESVPNLDEELLPF